MNDYVDPPQVDEDDLPGGLHPITWLAIVTTVEIALAALWIFRASIWS